MMGNYQVRFLGGCGSATSCTYPTPAQMATGKESPVAWIDGHGTVGRHIKECAIDRVERRDPAFLESHRPAKVKRDQLGDRHNGVEAEKKGGRTGVVDDFGKLLMRNDRRAPEPGVP